MAAELDAMAMAAPAASALVTEIVRGGWATLRETLGGFFLRHYETPVVERQLEMLDTAEQTLAEAAEADRDGARRQLEQRLVLQLATYLDNYPDMTDELAAILPAAQDLPPTGGPAMTAQYNSYSQIVQASGNVEGGAGGINYGVPPRNPGI